MVSTPLQMLLQCYAVHVYAGTTISEAMVVKCETAAALLRNSCLASTALL